MSVIENPDDQRMLVIDGFGASGENHTGTLYMEWMGRLPMLLHDDPQDPLVICFGTGQTAHAVRDERPRALDIVELSPAVLRTGSHFEKNEGVLQDERIRPIVMDGRAWLRRSDQLYDVITLEPMPPEFAGVNALYSVEFYEIAARRLREGGVIAQWLPLHLLPPHFARSVARTFQQVFPDAILWIDPYGTGILLGRGAGVDTPLGSIWPGLERAGPDRNLADSDVRARVALGARALARYASTGDVITDDNQLLAYGRIRSERRAGGSVRPNLDDIMRIGGEEGPE